MVVLGPWMLQMLLGYTAATFTRSRRSRTDAGRPQPAASLLPGLLPGADAGCLGRDDAAGALEPEHPADREDRLRGDPGLRAHADAGGRDAAGPVAAATFVLGIAQEVLLGLVFSFAVQIVFCGVQTAGQLLGIQMGSTSRPRRPVGTAGQSLLHRPALRPAGRHGLPDINGHHWVIQALQSSFAIVPVGQFAVQPGGVEGTRVARRQALESASPRRARRRRAVCSPSSLVLIVARAAPQRTSSSSACRSIGLGLLALFQAMPGMIGALERLLRGLGRNLDGLFRRRCWPMPSGSEKTESSRASSGARTYAARWTGSPRVRDLTAAVFLLVALGRARPRGPRCPRRHGAAPARLMRRRPERPREMPLSPLPRDLREHRASLARALRADPAVGDRRTLPRPVPVSWEGLKPQLSRVNPMQGFSRLSRPRDGSTASRRRSSSRRSSTSLGAVRRGLGRAPRSRAGARASWHGVAAVVSKLLASPSRSRPLAIAVLDYGHRWWEHEKSLRMTKEEVRLEGREQEGNPDLRSAAALAAPAAGRAPHDHPRWSAPTW